ncbi:MAG: IclR family transcriptional regulator [Methylibium sp.]|nr:IclR family transcriptional regulator [Methylibium sp.]
MPRRSASPSIAELSAAPGGAAAVDKALSLLAAFRSGDSTLSLAELAARTQLYKSTALRLLASLEHARLLQREADGRYALGPELARLAALQAASFSLEAQLLPLLRELVAKTQESAAFHVRQGEQRLCLLRVDSPQLLRDHVRAGDVLPLDRGAGGRVLLAFAGQRGRLYAQIRSEGHALLSDDRVPGLTGISAPVWKPGAELAGALTLTLPSSRLQPSLLPELLAAAREATLRLGGTPTSMADAQSPASTARPASTRRVIRRSAAA